MRPNVVHGNDMRGLVRYLVGPGRANEHTNPHVVGGDDYLMAMFGGQELSLADAGEIASWLEAPRKAMGVQWRESTYTKDEETGRRVKAGYEPRNVMHFSLSLPPSEDGVSEEKWGSIAHDFMVGMGMVSEDPQESVQWVAIDHGVNKGGSHHIHIAATRTRLNGKGVFFPRASRGDFGLSQKVCAELEETHDLQRTYNQEASQVRRGYSRAELEQAKRLGTPETVRDVLEGKVRACASAAHSEGEWVRSLRAQGVVVKPYFASGSVDVVRGYKVALNPKETEGRWQFMSGTHLARDLSLPKLRAAWGEPSLDSAQDASDEWQAAMRGQKIAHPERAGAGDVDVAAHMKVLGKRGDLSWVDSLDVDAPTPQWSRLAHETAGAWAAWAEIDPDAGAAMRDLARQVSYVAQDREYQGQRMELNHQVLSVAAFSHVLLATSRTGGDRSKVLAVLMMTNLLKATDALLRYQRAHEGRVAAQRVARASKVMARNFHSSHYDMAGRPAPKDARAHSQNEGRGRRPLVTLADYKAAGYTDEALAAMKTVYGEAGVNPVASREPRGTAEQEFNGGQGSAFKHAQPDRAQTAGHDEHGQGV
ncbi:MAG: relaxase/mobilization nuclease domain-containing protein [Propionibacterium sp.]|nr:relaxase/mobilization nuclease domain-containing protein [Propionibacterium sp.]